MINGYLDELIRVLNQSQMHKSDKQTLKPILKRLKIQEFFQFDEMLFPDRIYAQFQLVVPV